MSKGIAIAWKIYDKMKLWCEAFHDEFITFAPAYKKTYEKDLDNS